MELQLVQTKKEEASKKKSVRFIEKQIYDNKKGIQYTRNGNNLSRFKENVKYWEKKLEEAQVLDVLVVQDQNEVIADISDEVIITQAELQAQSFLEGIEADEDNDVVEAFRSEGAFYLYKGRDNPLNRDYTNEEIEANIKALALAIRELPEEEYLSAMSYIHGAIER